MSPFVMVAPMSVAVAQPVVMTSSQQCADERNHRAEPRPHARASTLSRVDALAGLLDGPRAQGAFLLKVVLGPPWSLRIADEAPLAIFTVLDGNAWFVHPAMDGPVELALGDTVVTCGPDHYVVADRPDRASTLFIGPGGDCRDAAGDHPPGLLSPRVRGGGDGPTRPGAPAARARP